MHSRFTRWAVGATVALSLFGAVGVAQASSLTSAQVSAIIGLLQSFGADQSVINNVSATLSGVPITNVCTNVTHNFGIGATDANTGGDLSRLITFLDKTNYLKDARIDGTFNDQVSTALHFWQKSVGLDGVGVVGPKTRAAMKCGKGNDTRPSATTLDSNSLNANTPTPTITGKTPLASLRIVIVSGKVNLPTSLPNGNTQSLQNLVWSDATDHGGQVRIYDSGMFSAKVTQGLTNGYFTVGVYEVDSIYSGQGFQGYGDEKLLSTGILNVAYGAN